ncbi:MAG: family 43 glycosylhydrolase, partial [Sedimentisphaerales bacterium]|nr:family 43 glycosylhydrolase [Sedimentisphaerales bacterium]
KIYSLARRPRRHAIEAAFVIFREGFYYLFVSFDNCCDGVNSTYKVMVGRSRTPTGPYLDIQGNPMEDEGGSLVLASYDNWRGPGHNSILHTPKGDYIVHHTYDAREENGARNLQIRPLLWDQAGWPLPGEPVETMGKPKSSITKSDLAGTWEHMVNFQSPSTIELLSDGTIKDKPGDRWITQDGILELYWPNPEAPGGVWIDHCIIAPDGQSYIGRNQTGMVVRGKRL